MLWHLVARFAEEEAEGSPIFISGPAIENLSGFESPAQWNTSYMEADIL